MGPSHDDLVQFLQVDEDATAMVRRIQSFQLQAGAFIAASQPYMYRVGQQHGFRNVAVPKVSLNGAVSSPRVFHIQQT